MNIGRRTFAFSAASFLALPATAQEAWPARPVHPRGALSAGQCRRHQRPYPARTAVDRDRAAPRHRQSRRRLGHHGQRLRRPLGTQRLHAAASRPNSPIASGPWVTKNVPYVVERDFTPIAGIARGGPRPAGRVRRAGEHHRRVRGLCEGQSRQDQLRLVRPGQSQPPDHGDAAPASRPRHGACPLSRQRPGAARPGRGPHPSFCSTARRVRWAASRPDRPRASPCRP